jgi:hypothetical protein
MIAERVIGYGTVLLVGGGLSAAFLMAGSPQHARKLALDERRVSDLWQISETLRDRGTGSRAAVAPPALDAAMFGSHADGSSIATDPQTHEPYEYERIGATRYRLCANFAFASAPAEATPYARIDPRLRHRAGRSCYLFSVVTQQMQAEPATLDRST